MKKKLHYDHDPNPTGNPPSWVDWPFFGDFGEFAAMVFELTPPRVFVRSPSNLVRSLWTSWGAHGIKSFFKCRTAHEIGGGKVRDDSDVSHQKNKTLITLRWKVRSEPNLLPLMMGHGWRRLWKNGEVWKQRLLVVKENTQKKSFFTISGITFTQIIVPHSKLVTTVKTHGRWCVINMTTNRLTVLPWQRRKVGFLGQKIKLLQLRESWSDLNQTC